MTQMLHDSTSPARQLWTFHGGLHLADNKLLSAKHSVLKIDRPQKLILPLQQHIGAPAQPVVKVGDLVGKGQQIAIPTGQISAAVHASSSGTVVAIDDYPIPHPSGLSATCIVIETDGDDRWVDLPEPMQHFAQLPRPQILERIRDSGIVGMGGATFPSHVKLSPGTPIQTLILNGAECEPYISCDDRLMQDDPQRVLAGLAILQYLLKPEESLIGIEDNKPQAIASMRQAVREFGLSQTHVVSIPTLYPSGGEKQLIRILTGKEVPSHGLPAQIGVVCHNVATSAAIADAVLEGKPLISRLVTVTGEGIQSPGNREVLIGTPIDWLLAQCGGYTEQMSRLILGGPMMGQGLASDQVPVTKGSNCLLAASEDEAPVPLPATPCIRCGACAAVCPANLLPQQLYWHARAKNLEKAQDYHLFDCIECGCCSQVCPAHIPLVQYYRYAKNESWAQERDKKAAERARQRHEARSTRLARLEQERKANLRKKKEQLNNNQAADKNTKKAAIDAALKRVAAKKAAQQQNTDSK